MNSSSDAAETMVRMGLQGTEFALKITGSATKQLTAIILAILKDKKQTKGKASLTKMLKTGKPLNVFSVRKEDLKTFQREAKRYGILYTALIDKKNKSLDGMVDILVREEDAPKINRIVERFKLSTYDRDKILKEVEKSKEQTNVSPEDKLVDEIIAKPKAKVEVEQVNPTLAKTEKSPLSEQDSAKLNKELIEEGTKSEKKSVSEKLKTIKNEMTNDDLGDSNKKERLQVNSERKTDLTSNSPKKDKVKSKKKTKSKNKTNNKKTKRVKNKTKGR